MKRIVSILIVILSMLITALALTGCGAEKADKETDDHKDEGEQHSEVVQLSQEEMDEFGIELAQAGPGKLEMQVSLPGEIIIPPDNLAHIHPRFPGMVKKVFKHIGDRVKKGEILAIIEGNESLVEYEVKSLIDGTIVEKHLSLGEVVDDSEHGFVVADLNKLWAILDLYQKDLPHVKVGQKVSVSAGLGMPESPGKINYISPIIDEISRTAEARVVLNNLQGYWKPGLFVKGKITISNVDVALLVPTTAIEYYEEQKVVFVQSEEGFEPRAIRIGRTNKVAVEIVDGLKHGETYVIKGGFTIKAELQKSELGEGHGH